MPTRSASDKTAATVSTPDGLGDTAPQSTDRYAIFGWLRVVAIHEAYRLSAIYRRDARLERRCPERAALKGPTDDTRQRQSHTRRDALSHEARGAARGSSAQAAPPRWSAPGLTDT